MTVIKELEVERIVYCKRHGWGRAFMIIDYGYNVNTVWIVRLKGGIVKHFLSDDIRDLGNPMNGDGLDIDIPRDWEK